MTHRPTSAPLALAALLAAACQGSSTGDTAGSVLHRCSDLWTASAIHDYTYDYSRAQSGGTTGALRIVVRGDTVSAATRLVDGLSVPSSSVSTISGLYHEALTDYDALRPGQQHDVAVDCDASTGVPGTVSFQLGGSGAADYVVAVSDFTRP